MIDPTVVAIPMYIGLMIAESASFKLWPNRNQCGYGKKDAAISISMDLGSLVVAAIFGIVTFGFYSWIYEYRIFDIGSQMGALPGVATFAAWALLLVVDDFGYYWFHRVHHESRFFWAAHVTHHSSEYYNLSTALRQS